MRDFIRYLFETRYMAVLAGVLGIVLAVLVISMSPSESEPTYRFEVTEFRDKYGRVCTAIVSNRGGWGATALALDCERHRANFGTK